MSDAPGLRTPSLQRRVTVMAVVLIGVLLLALALITDVVVGSRLEGQLRQRLADRSTVAVALADQVDAADLARRLEGDGVSVIVRTSSGQVVTAGQLASAVVGGGGDQTAQAPSSSPGAGGPRGGGPGGAPSPPPKAPDAVKKKIVTSGDRLSLTTSIGNGETVTLLADAGDVRRTQDQVRLALAISAAAVLLAVVVLVPLVVRRALRPLAQMTGVARSITGGDRERRMNPRSPATDLGRTASAFDDAFDAVVGAEERVRAFLADAAHELRTPISGVQAAAEHVLRDDPPRAEREQALLGLVRETRRAGRLVEDMLTMGRIDQGLGLERAPVDLVALATDVVERYAVSHPGVHLEVGGEAGPVVVPADADRLVQVLGNLLDNALHVVAATGTVRLEVWADEGGDPSWAGVDVVDDGPGVPDDDRERIFERLVRLDADRSRHRGGAGLGLPIARGLARAHGGDLTLVAGGVGARFRLRLPRAAESKP